MKPLAVLAILTLAACASTPTAELRTYPLKHVRATQVMDTLAREFMRDRVEMKELVAEAKTNSIVARGTQEILERLEHRIRELDVP